MVNLLYVKFFCCTLSSTIIFVFIYHFKFAVFSFFFFYFLLLFILARSYEDERSPQTRYYLLLHSCTVSFRSDVSQ